MKLRKTMLPVLRPEGGQEEIDAFEGASVEGAPTASSPKQEKITRLKAIQKIVTEKSVVTDVRFATLIDFIYCIILFYFKLHSKVPMSTTWVFIGLLAGREIGMAIMKSGENSMLKSLRLGFKDMTYALIGLVVSIAIAIGVNDNLSVEIMLTEMPVQFAKAFGDFFVKLGIGS